MSGELRQPDRRERNKQEKLRRITDAASRLFAERGVEEVTTREIADAADIGTGTLFFYAKNKGELLLLVQNSQYGDALASGVETAETLQDPLDAVMAVLRSVVECNRKRVDNGRTYLREMVFGDVDEPHHREALELSARTEAALATVIARDGSVNAEDATVRARVISAVMFLAMAAPFNVDHSVDQVIQDIEIQVRVLI